MNRILHQLALVSVAATIVAGCADQLQQPTEPSASAPAVVTSAASLSYVIPPCPATQADAQNAIDVLLPQLFAPGAGRRGKAQGLSNDMERARNGGNASLADVKADSLINFALQQYYAGQLLNQSTDLAGTQQRLVSFITYIYCFNGYSPLPDFDLLLSAQNSVLIRNSTPTTVVNNELKDAGVKVDQGDVPSTVDGQPFFGTYVSIVKTTSPLPTSLDWYGIDGYKAGAFEFIADPAVTFTDAVLTGVCINYDDAIVTSPNDLRLAHEAPANLADVAPGNYVVTTAGGSIEVGAPASTTALGLNCGPLNVASSSPFGRALQLFTSAMLPQELAAGTAGGGVGSTVKTFSPFAVVDIQLNSSSTGPSSPQEIPLNSTTITAPVTVTATTRNSHAGISGIPVNFTTSTAGSSFSPATPSTDATGTASSTWTLVSGTNTGTGTPALSPLVFTPATADFSVNVSQVTPLIFAGPATLPNGVQGTAYPTTTFTASGGKGAGTYSWAVTAGSLPTGLTLNSATGVLSGTSTAAGAYSFDVQVTSGAQSQSRTYTDVVIALPAVSITTISPLASATVGASYSQTLQASGGAGAGSYAWSLASGSLPTGLSLSAAGVISGTPSVVGLSSFDARVTSGTGLSAVTSTKTFTLAVINPTAVTLTFSVPPSKSACYAVNRALTPGIVVMVADGSGHPLSGVAVNMVAVTNNGSKVAVSPSSVVSSGGFASFGGPTINKTGGYALIISTAAPWPVATNTSAKFTISPSCP
jgi:hypothetical protein